MYGPRVASHASLVGGGRSRSRRGVVTERMKNRAVLVCPVSLYQKKICWVVCGALLLVWAPDGVIRPMERETVAECIPVWLMLTLLVWLVNGMESSRWNITFKAFKLLMLTNLFLLLCSLVLLNVAFKHVCTSCVESFHNLRIMWIHGLRLGFHTTGS